jgi:hypothetical protein
MNKVPTNSHEVRAKAYDMALDWLFALGHIEGSTLAQQGYAVLTSGNQERAVEWLDDVLKGHGAWTQRERAYLVTLRQGFTI